MESKQRLLEPQLVQTGRADQFSRKVFCDGMRDGVPIALGYFAVSFSLGIAARKAGFTPFQGFLVSLLNNASAGEYAAFALIMANATYFEVAVITLIANARYLLMSCALAQRTRIMKNADNDLVKHLARPFKNIEVAISNRVKTTRTDRSTHCLTS